MKVLIFEDMIADQEAAYRDICDFLQFLRPGIASRTGLGGLQVRQDPAPKCFVSLRHSCCQK